MEWLAWRHVTVQNNIIHLSFLLSSCCPRGGGGSGGESKECEGVRGKQSDAEQKNLSCWEMWGECLPGKKKEKRSTLTLNAATWRRSSRNTRKSNTWPSDSSYVTHGMSSSTSQRMSCIKPVGGTLCRHFSTTALAPRLDSTRLHSVWFQTQQEFWCHNGCKKSLWQCRERSLSSLASGWQTTISATSLAHLEPFRRYLVPSPVGEKKPT